MQEIIKVDYNDFGLEENQAKNIAAMFQPMLGAMVDLENEFNQIIKKDVSDKTSIEALRLLKKYKETRIATSRIHKEAKLYFLQGGRFVDSWKKAQSLAAGEKEEKLKTIANYKEIQESKRLLELKESRSQECLPFLTSPTGEEFALPRDIELMDTFTFRSYLKGIEIRYKNLIAKEAKEKEEEKEKERIHQLSLLRWEEYAPLQDFVANKIKLNELGFLSDKEYKDVIHSAKLKKSKQVAIDEKNRLENEKLRKQEASRVKKQKEKEQKIKLLGETRRSNLAAAKVSKVFLTNLELGRMTARNFSNFFKESIENAKREMIQRQDEIAKEKEKRKARQLLQASDAEKAAALINDLKIIHVPDFKSRKAIQIIDRISSSLDNLMLLIQKNIID